jgi:GrpB-like predicted nucleotidyltransferase (UPF0157 family)
MPERFSLIGEPQSGPVVLVEYSPDWPRRFALERRRLGRVLGNWALRIEHIGSTAVPELAAKPIVDILVAVADLAEIDAIVPALALAGYAPRVIEPGHRMFRNEPCDVHVHLWSDLAEVERHLVFRDRLRASDEERALYQSTKLELAPHNWASRDEYAEAKTAVIADIMARIALQSRSRSEGKK